MTISPPNKQPSLANHLQAKPDAPSNGLAKLKYAIPIRWQRYDTMVGYKKLRSPRQREMVGHKKYNPSL